LQQGAKKHANWNLGWGALQPFLVPFLYLLYSIPTRILCLLRHKLLRTIPPWSNCSKRNTLSDLGGNTLVIKHRAPGLQGLSSIHINTFVKILPIFCSPICFPIGTTNINKPFFSGKKWVGYWFMDFHPSIWWSFCWASSRPLDLLEGSPGQRRGGRRTNVRSGTVCHAMNLGIAAVLRAEDMDEKH